MIQPETPLTSAYPIVDTYAENHELNTLFSFAAHLVQTLSSAVEVVRKPHVDADLECGRSRLLLVRSAAFLLNLVNVNMAPFSPQTLPSGLAEATRATCDDVFLSLSFVAMQLYVSRFYTAVVCRYLDGLERKSATLPARRKMWTSALRFIAAVDLSITSHCLQGELVSRMSALNVTSTDV